MFTLEKCPKYWCQIFVKYKRCKFLDFSSISISGLMSYDCTKEFKLFNPNIKLNCLVAEKTKYVTIIKGKKNYSHAYNGIETKRVHNSQPLSMK